MKVAEKIVEESVFESEAEEPSRLVVTASEIRDKLYNYWAKLLYKIGPYEGKVPLPRCIVTYIGMIFPRTRNKTLSTCSFWLAKCEKSVQKW